MKKLFKSSIELPEQVRKNVCEVIQQQLSNLVDLQLQLKQAHWNVKGPNFFSYHKLFEELASSLDEHIDTLAERIASLGGLAAGGVRSVGAQSILKDLPIATTKDKDLVSALQSRYKVAATSARHAIEMIDELDDDGTEDLLIALSQTLDKGAWFLDATRS